MTEKSITVVASIKAREEMMDNVKNELESSLLLQCGRRVVSITISTSQ